MNILYIFKFWYGYSLCVRILSVYRVNIQIIIQYRVKLYSVYIFIKVNVAKIIYFVICIYTFYIYIKFTNKKSSLLTSIINSWTHIFVDDDDDNVDGAAILLQYIYNIYDYIIRLQRN